MEYFFILVIQSFFFLADEAQFAFEKVSDLATVYVSQVAPVFGELAEYRG